MTTIKMLFAFLLGVIAVLWSQAQQPLPQPMLMPVEVTRIVEVTPVVPVCGEPLMVFGNADGSLVQCGDKRYEWTVKP